MKTKNIKKLDFALFSLWIKFNEEGTGYKINDNTNDQTS
jgi:hypothetical protein